jgi:hypothetical protein
VKLYIPLDVSILNYDHKINSINFIYMTRFDVFILFFFFFFFGEGEWETDIFMHTKANTFFVTREGLIRHK